MTKYKHYQDGQQLDKGYRTYHTAKGGCPTFIPKSKTYNVIKYYSDRRDFVHDDEDKPAEPACSPTPTKSLGVVTDGRYAGSSYPYMTHYKNDTSQNVNITDTASKFLNISNGRQVYEDPSSGLGYGDNCRKSIMYIPTDDELREKDGNGDYVFHLYEKSVSRTIIDPVTTSESTETVDSMEWIFQHTKVEKCQNGWIWLELHDFEISGYDNDNTLYAYYWESTREESATINTQLSNLGSPFEHYRALAGDNHCVQAIKLSDLVSGSGKKLIIGCNRFTTSSEEIYINLMIGLKPNDIARSYQYKHTYDVTSGNVIYHDAIFDEVGSDVVFKYKKAEFKFGGVVDDTWNNAPIFYPDEGLIKVRPAPHVRSIDAYWSYLDGGVGQGDSDVNTDGVGFANGGVKRVDGLGFSLGAWAEPQFFGFQAYGARAGLKLAYYSNFTMAFSMMSVFAIGFSQMKAGQVLSLRLPRAIASWSGSATGFDEWDGEYPPTPTFPNAFSTASVNIALYVGGPVTVGNQDIKWVDLANSLYKIETWTLDEYCSTNRAPYDYISTASPQTHKDDLSNGYPRFVPNDDSNKIDNYRYVDLDISDILNNLSLGTYHFYLTLETASKGIKNGTLVYPVYDDSEPGSPGTQVYPTGYHHDDKPTVYTTAEIIFLPDYYSEAEDITGVDSQYNFGSYVHKAPQIIANNEKPVSENYYQ